MEKILSYNSNNLLDKKVLEDIKSKALVIINDLEYKKAYNLANELLELLKSLPSGSKFWYEYKDIIARLQFLAFNFWSEKTQLDLFEDGLVSALRDEDVLVEDRIKAALIELAIFDRDEFKNKIIKHIQSNKEVLTESKIKTGTDKEQPGTVANWIKDYRFRLGGGLVDDVKKIDYLENSENVKDLSLEDKKVIHRLINLFESLKISSETDIGFEEDILFEDPDGELKIYSHGVFQDLNTETGRKTRNHKLKPPIEILSGNNILQNDNKVEDKIVENQIEIENKPPLEQSPLNKEIIDAYKGDQKKFEVINKIESKLESKLGRDFKKIREEFFIAVQKNKADKTIALLRIMAKEDDLLKFMTQDEKLEKFLAAIWQKQYGPELVEEFRQNPGQPKFLALFLKYVLEDRMKMNTSDAARVGLQIGNIFVSQGKKEYNKVAYFDMKDKTFDWFN